MTITWGPLSNGHDTSCKEFEHTSTVHQYAGAILIVSAAGFHWLGIPLKLDTALRSPSKGSTASEHSGVGP